MRIFAGGHFVNEDNKKIPSLFTCDIIDPYTKISINENFFLWKDVLNTQLKDWEIDYERDTPAQIERKRVFDRFWGMVGEKFCLKNGYIWKKKVDNVQEEN